MQNLAMEMLQEIDGGINWAKVVGVTTCPVGVGVIVGDFEED